MAWVEKVALGSMLGMSADASDEDLRLAASSEIEDALTDAARLWVLAYPHEAAELRDADLATSANKFLSLAENASHRAVSGRP